MARKGEEGKLPMGTKVPDHVAMILDGNRRWARARGLKPWEGHKTGYEAIRRVARASRQLGVHTFTVWALSTENWRERSEVEAKELMRLLRLALVEAEREVHKDKVRLVHLGRKDRLPMDIVKYLVKLEKDTARYTSHVFNIALDYGGRDEIVRAINKMIEAGEREVEVKTVEGYLDTRDQPYPNVDLLIRTSGEQRTSGLMTWQMDYAEFYFEADHLPDFTVEKLEAAILDYSRRRRRFGGNDAEEHLKFDPKLVADLEVKWRHELAIGPGEKFRDYVVRYVREQYGLSKELALEAGTNLARALVYRKQEDWESAKGALKGLYDVVKINLGLAFEPQILANFEVNLWRRGETEEGVRELLAEKYRFSEFQAGKSAHLAHLANVEVGKRNWEKARWYMERFYQALKERVA